MTIEHKDITEANLHEPKGVSTALSGTSYKATGLGSGSWRKTLSSDFQGVSGDSGIANRFFVSDGSNGFKIVTARAHGTMAITNNNINIPLTAVADGTFNTPSQYSLMTPTTSPWVGETLNGIVFDTDKLTVPVTGIYYFSCYMNIGLFPATNAKVSFRYKVNGTTFSTRKPIVKAASASDEGQIFANGLISLAASDYVQIYIATDVSGNLLIKDANFTLHLVG